MRHVLRAQFRQEQLAFWRNPAAAFFTVAFPLLLLIIFSTLNGSDHSPLLGGQSYTEYFTPSMVAFGIMSACFANLTAHLVRRRESGQLKRIRVTPMPLRVLLGVLVANAFLVSLMVTVINGTVGIAFYDVTPPQHWAALLLTIVTGSGAFCAVAVAFSTLVPNPEAIDPMVWGTFMPVVFISGSFFPIAEGSFFHHLAALLPVQHLINAMLAAFSTGIAWHDLTVVALWGLGAAVYAAVRFRWEPSTR